MDLKYFESWNDLLFMTVFPMTTSWHRSPLKTIFSNFAQKAIDPTARLSRMILKEAVWSITDENLQQMCPS